MTKLVRLLPLGNIVLLIVLFSQIGNSSRYYNSWTGEISCDSRTSCLHEVAHKYDASHGWISHTQEYQNAIDTYRVMIWEYPEARNEHAFEIYQYPGLGSLLWLNTNPLTTAFWSGGWGGYSEIFADFVMWSDGDPSKCPQGIKEWYDWNYLSLEMERLGYGR